MREFQKKKVFKRVANSKIAVVVLVGMVLFFGRATWGVFQKEQESAGYAALAQTQLNKMTERQDTLTQEIDRLQTQEGIEEEIRSKYNVSKSGENVLVIIDKEKPTSTPPEVKKSWWGSFVDWLK